jgi:hypothetical protein
MAEYDNQTSTFAGDNYSTSIDNQKRALLASMAERGAEGAQAFKTAQANNADRRQVALNAAAARGAAINAPESLNAELRDTFDSMSNVGLGDSALSAEREMARIAASNSAYLDQMKTVAPLREQYYNAELAKIVAQQNSGGGGGGSTLDPVTNPYQVDLDKILPPRAWPGLPDFDPEDHIYQIGGAAYQDALFEGHSRVLAAKQARLVMYNELGPHASKNLDMLENITNLLNYQFSQVTSTNADNIAGNFSSSRNTTLTPTRTTQNDSTGTRTTTPGASNRTTRYTPPVTGVRGKGQVGH